ncbi:MAG TPA: hypothetical protein VEW08_09530 [Steroidobacteraceae bacterium]|nr:hypothetical protein [Steroidobacteraceae bacterium]
MRNVSILAMGLLLAASASAQAPASKAEWDAYRSQMVKRMRIVDRAYELRPKRRDEPLRYLNISDYEVREIQLVAEKYLPQVLLNISPVVTGCPCEEGPQCTDQVYIVAETPQSSKGLQLSRIRNAWVVGSVQQWWLKRDALAANSGKMSYAKYESAVNELVRDFPMCVGELVPAENSTASTPKAEPKK